MPHLQKKRRTFFDNPRENFFLINELNFLLYHYIFQAELMKIVGYLFYAFEIF